VVYRVEHVDYEAEEVLNLSGGIIRRPGIRGHT